MSLDIETFKSVDPPIFIEFSTSHEWKEGGSQDDIDSEVDTLKETHKPVAKTQERERMYYADWIRVISVHSVIFVHCLLNAADTTEMYERDGMEKKEGICKTMAQIGMPMFFYISGMSSTFFNAEKNGYVAFVLGKVNRLLVPLFLAILTLLVPRLYFSQDFEPWTRVDDKIENNFIVYFFKVFPSLPSKLSWLWFLVVLFIVMLLNYPLMAWSQRRKKNLPLDFKQDGKLVLIQVISLAVWAIPCSFMVDEKDAKTYLVPSISVLALFYAVMFFL